MKKMLTLVFMIGLNFGAFAKENNEARLQVGSTFSSPVSSGQSLYFLATTGVLYKSDSKMGKLEKLFEGKEQTTGALAISGNVLYWGEGLHNTRKSKLYAFDIKSNKMIKEIDVDGHVERAALVKEGVVYIGLGYGGVAAYKENSLEKIWSTKSYNGKPIHSDSNIVAYGNSICAAAIYDVKGILCFEAKTGKVTNYFELKRNPKSEIALVNETLIGFATEANMAEAKWTIPSDFYVINLKDSKVQVNKELRGFNFFAPLIVGDYAFVTLSTGDFISIALKDGKIGFIGEFSEPFINNTFEWKNSYCALGIMGKLLCYSKTKNGLGISMDKRFFETVVGKIETINGQTYAPSRMGYFLVE